MITIGADAFMRGSAVDPEQIAPADERHWSSSSTASPIPELDPSLSFTLHLRDARGMRTALLYRPHVSELRRADTGESVSLEPVGMDYDRHPNRRWPVAKAISPQNPGRKRFPVRALKIQMGLKCNYRCSYCNQTARPDDSHGNPALARQFLEAMPRWFAPPPESDKFRIEFWGGEPFAYWRTMRLLGDELRKRYPRALFSVVTNGSILDDDKIAWLERNEVLVTISHDGPGQRANRGIDPFDAPKSAAALRKLYLKLRPKGLINFNCVLATNNKSLAAIREFIAERLESPPEDIPLATEEVVLPYESAGMRLSLQSTEDCEALKNTLTREIADGSAFEVLNVREKLRDFFLSLAKGRPSYALTQRCGMDREDTIAVDLAGNVLTCQNTAAGDGHCIGTVKNFEGIRLNTSWHWMARPECRSCPVLQLCKGGCMRLKGRQWEQACRNSYSYNLAMLKAAVAILAG